MKDIEENNILNNSLYKLDPYKKLTEEQEKLKEYIFNFCYTHRKDEHAIFLINGTAGTGKSLLLSSIFNSLQNISKNDTSNALYHTDNYLLVNHPEMLKLYKEIASETPNLLKKNFERPTTFINRMTKNNSKADIVLIDEAHLLLTKKDPYNNFKQDNQLEEIIKRSYIVILVFDEQQVLKFKSYWKSKKMQQFLEAVPSESYQLTTQFRVQANHDIYEWIDRFSRGKLKPLPEKQAFDFRIFADANEMYELIKEQNAKYGLCRMLATYDFPYKLDGEDYYVTTDTFKLRWDRSKPQDQKPWAERPDTIEEVGSVYTIQGFDLNYAGIILGPSISYDPEEDELVINPNRYEDNAAYMGSSKIDSSPNAKCKIILNSINVLMTRARKGMYIYAIDSELRKKLLSLM
jgi:DUF2075 family protein/nucleoside-triphosphatase THEP1